MLPPLLCEELCTLNPGVDRLAVSCIWPLPGEGTLVVGKAAWFGRTVIRSCCKLDYGTAQRVIEGEINPRRGWGRGQRGGGVPEELWEPTR
ncbi:unnamed protein product, partial [Discosporangium mesarthrocarpum]